MWGSGDDKDPIGRVLPTFMVELNEERLSSSRLALLKQFTEPVSTQDKRMVFRVTPETVERGRSLGVTSREIMFLLRHINGRDLPENVASSVAEWAERFGRAVLQRAIWFSGAPDVMNEVEKALEGLEPLAATSDVVTLFSQLDLDELVAALKRLGFMPAVDRLQPVWRPYTVPVTKENGIFTHSLRAAYDLFCCLRDTGFGAVAEPAARLYRRLGQQLGLRGRSPRGKKEQLLMLRTLAGQRMWDLQRRLVELYLADQEYSEIGGFDPLVADQVVRELSHLRQPQQVRKRMADYLCEVNPFEWTSIVPFVRRLRKESPKVIRATRSWDWSYLRRQDRPWEEVEDYWLIYLLTHEFWWLGIVELYWTKAQGPMAFRLTRDGLNLLTGEEPPVRRAIATAAAGWMILEPQQMTVDEVCTLMQFVQPQPLTCQWSVHWDRDSLHDAIVRGAHINQLAALLEKYCSDIPVELTNLISELRQQGERATIHEGYLLTCQEAVLLDSLLDVKSLALCIAERLSPTAAVVYPAAVNRLVRGAERNGISISMECEESEA